MVAAPDLYAERVVLGVSMLRPELAPLLMERAKVEDFSADWHRNVARAIQKLVVVKRPPILPLVAWTMERQGTLDDTGGEPFLASLVGGEGAWLHAGCSASTLCAFADTVHGIAERMKEAQKVLDDAAVTAREIVRGGRRQIRGGFQV